MSKEISFFVASSIVDLSLDREMIGNFIRKVNDIFHPFGVRVQVYMCEDETMNHSVALDGSQKCLDDLIVEADLCFVIFWHNAGVVTEHEFRLAIETFKKHGTPKVVVYFKSMEDGECIPDDIARIMRVVDEELMHYHREYTHIDSLKLGIITQLHALGFVNADIKVEDEHIRFAGKTVISTNDLPLFSQNEEYCSLMEDLKVAKRECAELLKEYSENKDNAKTYRRYLKKVKERDRLQEDVTELADGIINIGMRIARILSDNSVNSRIKQAIKCFDNGDYDGVLDILTPEDIKERINQLDVVEEQILMARNSIVEEFRLRILALEAQGEWDEVNSTYSLAVSQVENRNNMPKSIMFEYARFLYRQRKYYAGIEICNKL